MRETGSGVCVAQGQECVVQGPGTGACVTQGQGCVWHRDRGVCDTGSGMCVAQG